ncbi:MAG: dockerin type I repeat-containing protein, partial [Oscillospiraceae bacterium]|nr:dockerin type I repeat-containing protein [Oscillospiraceae bacterium]
DMVLYVGLDSRVEQVPAWLGEFERIRSAVTTSNDVTFGLFRKSLKAGESVTLGANGQSAYCMNYIVMAVPQTDQVLHDLNADGSFDVRDAVLLQKWILNIPGTTLPNPDAGDLDGDGMLDVYDLGLMKRELLQ